MYNPHAEIIEHFNRHETLLRDLVSKVNLISATSETMKAPATRRDAAEYLGISLPTLDQLIKSNQLPVFNVGRQVRIKWSDLEDYINKKGATK